MTPGEFAAKMREIYGDGEYGYDPERAHGKADDLIIGLLKELGYGEGAELFEKAEKWYA